MVEEDDEPESVLEAVRASRGEKRDARRGIVRRQEARPLACRFCETLNPHPEGFAGCPNYLLGYDP